jgi:hypothetical protein
MSGVALMAGLQEILFTRAFGEYVDEDVREIYGIPVRFEELVYEHSLAVICKECAAILCRIRGEDIFDAKPEILRDMIFHSIRVHNEYHKEKEERERFKGVPFVGDLRNKERPKQIEQIRKIRIITGGNSDESTIKETG